MTSLQTHDTETVVVPPPRPAPGSELVHRPHRPTEQDHRASADRQATWSLYQKLVATADIAVVAMVSFLGTTFSIGSAAPGRSVGYTPLTYSGFAVILAAGWITLLLVYGGWDNRVLGSGTSEYKRVAHASLVVFAIAAVTSYAARADIARGYLATVVPVGCVLMCAIRAGLRHWLHRQQTRGRLLSRVLVVGNPWGAMEFVRHLDRDAGSGFAIAGVCVPPVFTDATSTGAGLHVWGTTADLKAVIGRSDADVVVLTPTSGLSTHDIRMLSWDLEPTGIRLVIAPGVADIAGARVSIRPVAGLPLLVVEQAQFRGMRLVLKTLVDYLGALALLLVFAPVFAAAALAVKLTDGGSVFFRQTRVGKGGKPFRMCKFRSMVPNAHLKVDDARRSAGQQSAVFYKSADDARITRVGKFLRRTSIDELPQLLNVLTGSMSLIGPRPLVPGEGAGVDRFLERRILVKPGLTGLWQVSGRSDLSAAERVRLDFYYVENWSLAGDLVILFRTLTSVFARRGAV